MSGQTARSLARWLLWTRRRFVVVLAVVVLVVFGLSHAGSIARALAPREQPAAAATETPGPTPDPTTDAAPAPVSEQPPTPTTDPPAEPTADAAAEPSSPRAVAERFATLWAAPDLSAGKWLGRLLPLSTEEYGTVVLAQVDPANVPARAVKGTSRLLSQEQGTAYVAVPMDTMSLRIELVDVGGATWRVSDVKPLTGA